MSAATTTTSLSGASLQASRAALNAALAESAIAHQDGKNDVLEPGEIQEIEVDMESQAEGIKTVFSDPSNFNVKVRCSAKRFYPLCPGLCRRTTSLPT
jgi:translation initiation factor 4E